MTENRWGSPGHRVTPRVGHTSASGKRSAAPRRAKPRSKGLFSDVLDAFMASGNPTAIVSGGAKGADSLAAAIARAIGLPLIEHPPDWDKHGKAAGFVRNQLIVQDADVLVAFFGPGDETKGTNHTIRMARKKRIPVHIYYQDSS